MIEDIFKVLKSNPKTLRWDDTSLL